MDFKFILSASLSSFTKVLSEQFNNRLQLIDNGHVLIELLNLIIFCLQLNLLFLELLSRFLQSRDNLLKLFILHVNLL